ncbi:MAG: hypothetical protein WC346_10935 [Methanogenium sp.]|jgi:hypothetical protein
MKLVLSKNVLGKDRTTNKERLYAEAGDVLDVVLVSDSGKYYWCESKQDKNIFIPVLKTQVCYIIEEHDTPNNNEENNTDREDNST